MLAANIVNFFVPIVYDISPLNVYERRPFTYAYYAVIVYYCLTDIVLLRRFEKEYGARTFLNFWVYLIPVIVGTGLQFLFYGLSLAWMASAIGLAGLFMMQQNEIAYVDPLVRTYNRQYLDNILSAWISRGRGFAGVMIDIDDFKRINDSFGHSEGDRALKAVADILKRACKEREWVYRFAGDEFIVLKLAAEPGDMEAYMAEANRLLADHRGEEPYQLSLSYGVSTFAGGDVDAFMKEMDRNMYQMKARHHQTGG